MGRRPFSSKKKKAQLQARRARPSSNDGSATEPKPPKSTITGTVPPPTRGNAHGCSAPPGTSSRKHRYRLQLGTAAEEGGAAAAATAAANAAARAVDAAAAAAVIPAAGAPAGSLDRPPLVLGIEDVRPVALQGELGMPTRPAWTYGEAPATVDARERAYLADWVARVEATLNRVRTGGGGDADPRSALTSAAAPPSPVHSNAGAPDGGVAPLGWFERNPETWRQLWRVTEMADIVLLVADVRVAALHWAPSLVAAVRGAGKELVLVLNKVDLVSSALVAAWVDYFRKAVEERREAEAVAAAAAAGGWRAGGGGGRGGPGGVGEQGAKRRASRVRGWGVSGLIDAVASIPSLTDAQRAAVDGWRRRVEAGEEGEWAGLELDVEEEKGSKDGLDGNSLVHPSSRPRAALTIGLVGHPNVGKSTLLNALLGRHATSTSRTPGHTTHFQTLYLTRSLLLADSPGVVIPGLAPRALQVLAGLYPIAQLRRPYAAVAFLATYAPLVATLRLEGSAAAVRAYNGEDDEPPGGGDRPAEVWTAMRICEAYALQRGYFTAKAARLDTYRAANALLRLGLAGGVVLATVPPGWEGGPGGTGADGVCPAFGGSVGEGQSAGQCSADDDDSDENGNDGSDSSDRSNDSDGSESDARARDDGAAEGRHSSESESSRALRTAAATAEVAAVEDADDRERAAAREAVRRVLAAYRALGGVVPDLIAPPPREEGGAEAGAVAETVATKTATTMSTKQDSWVAAGVVAGAPASTAPEDGAAATAASAEATAAAELAERVYGDRVRAARVAFVGASRQRLWLLQEGWF
ncbi:hypothetical protein MMPV_000860 [Pyropia vietnamensis]